MRDALVALYEGNAASARPEIERALETTEKACYLWFEVGRARLLEGATDAGREALARFIALLRPGEGGEARLVTHMELAALHHERGDFDAAVGEYQTAIEALPTDPRPYLAMATFFRREGLAAEALDVLASAANLLEEPQRPWRFTLELGLVHADLGNDSQAIELLEEVVSYFTARQHLDLPPAGAVRLAQLHEKDGSLARALDLYHLLSQGSDTANLCEYHRQAARLLVALDRRDDARRMLEQAVVIASEDAEIRAAIDKDLAQLQ